MWGQLKTNQGYNLTEGIVLKKLLLTLLSLFSLQAAPELSMEGAVYVPERVGKMLLEYKDREFYAHNEKGSHKIQRCFIDKELRGMLPKDLAQFLQHGYIDVNNCGEDTYSLRARNRMRGGGPITGAIVYFGVKGIAYGIIASGIISGIRKGAHAGTATPPPVPDSGVEGAAAGLTIGLVGKALSKTAGDDSGVAGPVATTIMGTEAGREGAQAVVGVVGASIASGTATVASVTGAIESVAVAGAAWATAIPFLP